MFDLKKSVTFLIGLAVGYVIGRKIEKAYQKRIRGEGEMDISDEKNQSRNETFQHTRDDSRKEDVEAYESIIDDAGYSLNDDLSIITDDEFGTGEYEEVITLIYYADGVLADDSDFRVDPESSVGLEALKKFNDPDIDQVLVRNKKLKVDYEILRSLQRFDEIPYVEEG